MTLSATAIKWVFGSTNLQCVHEIDPFPQSDSLTVMYWATDQPCLVAKHIGKKEDVEPTDR